ncbi:heavy metal translocating P-type ATPase [Candidatus Parabeggiatoa sp. HSG14]|uniref:heavy metal translocating P-type ATPase n=1 Tax=Candidatus Parabeggiatoa sp. HSG14 TaxID=3055593 RepID=UPI0025A88573|nr:heavy metal translocating P-type ATPase [Thiotrichales bacterium HSG14]
MMPKNNISPVHCYHCGLPVATNNLFVTIDGEQQPMCCRGCQAVAQAIIAANLQDFYKYRTQNSPTGTELVPELLQQTTVYDNPAIQKRFVRYEDGNIREAALILEGITCAACVWLNERHLQTLPGVIDVRVNYSTHRAQVCWDNSRLNLSEILQAISQMGYVAHPYDPTRQQEVLERERKQQLRRLGVAGVLGMQVMMFSIALYAGAWYGIESEFQSLFSWINLVLTLPIIFYSAQSFFKSAWRDIRHKQVGMDVPIALALILAFIGSIISLISSNGHIYFDSIAMFVFFLLTGRYFELRAKQRSSQVAENLVHLVPTMATRLVKTRLGIIEELVLVADLVIGDKLLIRPGENIPADGIVLKGKSSVDESLLTGESHPMPKKPGQALIGGTVNVDNPLQMQVDKIGTDTVLSHILRLLERAQTEKPLMTQLADRVASWFVLGVLLLAFGVAIYWWQVNPEAWLTITLAVLVVTCPCALSLATPTAMTVATSTLTQAGLLTTRGHALETLAQATHFVFDKTGTLTKGCMNLLATHTFADSNAIECLQYAVALESYSEHPIAKALVTAGKKFTSNLNEVTDVSNHPGAGIQGSINNTHYFIGTPAFIATKTGLTLEVRRLEKLQAEGNTLVLLANSQALLSIFILGDEIRDGAKNLIQNLQQQGKTVTLLSGDHALAVERVAKTVGIDKFKAALSPKDKLRHVKALQAQGEIVAMIGDGVNDAPVLAQAQVSIAMGSSTQIARASADMILLTEKLPHLLIGIATATKTLKIIRQNILWAITYNGITLPAAAIGWIAPWTAALGMSCSSLLVVANALRLTTKTDFKKWHGSIQNNTQMQ